MSRETPYERHKARHVELTREKAFLELHKLVKEAQNDPEHIEKVRRVIMNHDNGEKFRERLVDVVRMQREHLDRIRCANGLKTDQERMKTWETVVFWGALIAAIIIAVVAHVTK